MRKAGSASFEAGPAAGSTPFLPTDRPGAVGLDNKKRLGLAPDDFTVVGADFVYQKVALGRADASDDEVAVAGVGDAGLGQ